MTFPLHPRLERIWNGEAGKDEQTERLASSVAWLDEANLGSREPMRSPAPILQAGGHRFDPGTLH